MGRDKWSSLFWMAVGIIICIFSVGLTLGTLRSPGPGFLPFATGAILAGLSLIYHLQSRKALSAEDKPKPIWKDKDRGIKMMLSVLALLVYALGMEYLGFLMSTFVFLAFLLRFIEPQRWSVVLWGSLLISSVSFLIFEVLLQCQLPRGPFQIF
jgi:putative tricarboxylic transport membrane protein